MTEEKTDTPPPKEKPPEQETEQTPPESTELIDKANQAAERIEKATEELNKTLKKQEALKIEKALGGTADAGQENKEETPEEYAKRVMKNEL